MELLKRKLKNTKINELEAELEVTKGHLFQMKAYIE